MAEPFDKVCPELRDVLMIMRDASDTLYALRNCKPDEQTKADWEMYSHDDICRAIDAVRRIQKTLGYALPTHCIPHGISAHRCMHDARYFWWFAYTLLWESRSYGKNLNPSISAMKVGMGAVKTMIANTLLCLEYCKMMM